MLLDTILSLLVIAAVVLVFRSLPASSDDWETDLDLQPSEPAEPAEPIDLDATARASTVHCPYCRDDVTQGLECPECAARVHTECWTEHGSRCPSCGKTGQPNTVSA